MPAFSINYLAVVIAAIAGFLVGWGWYTIFGKVWQDALGKKKEDCKPTPLPFVIAAIGCLLMAWMLAGLMGHLADVTMRGNQAFHGTKPIVTVIDAAHWLVVLAVMGAIIGAFGA